MKTNSFFRISSILVCTSILFSSCDEPLHNPESTGYVEIAAGGNHSLGVQANNHSHDLFAWGSNYFGQLGTELNSITSYTPFLVRQYGTYSSVSAGSGHTLVIDNGKLYSCGSNKHGQVGNRSLIDQHSLKEVIIYHDCGNHGCKFKSIAAGDTHSLALTTNGLLWAFGKNNFGQLGDGSTIDRKNPVLISTEFANAQIAAGGDHSFALKANGTLWAWGRNDKGQLGDGTNENKSVPVQVGTGFIKIDAGDLFSVGIKSDGTVWAWGINDHGQLGDGTYTNRNTPVMISDSAKLDGALLAVGGNHTLFMKEDETLWSWGFNEDGQLGIGSFLSQNIPVKVGKYIGVSKLAAGARHSFMIVKSESYPLHSEYKVDHGTLWAWGSNNDGQLGLGTGIISHVPMAMNLQ